MNHIFTLCIESNYKLSEIGCPESVIYQLTHHHNTFTHSLSLALSLSWESGRRKIEMNDGLMLGLEHSDVSFSPFKKDKTADVWVAGLSSHYD